MNAAFRQPVLVVMDEQSKVGEARRQASALAQELGFDETVCGQAAIVATEAATNLLKHSVGGALILHAVGSNQNRDGLEILAIDSGPGIRDLAECLSDGFSTTGTSGNGLGAIKRLAHSFDAYSQPEIGTAIWARFESAAPHHSPGRSLELKIGAVNLPITGERVCGDAWAMVERDGFSFLMMVDGLGHGSLAAEAASLAVRVFHEHSALEPEALIRATHAALRSTRGAAIAVARFDTRRGVLHYAGVGNIASVLVNMADGQTTSLISHNGTVGYIMSRVQTLEYPWTADSLLLMHSDGLATRWNLGRYPGLCRKEPALIAGVLYRDHKRSHDDVTVVVARQESRRPA
jgi:anti-sigma regulatory factor (Ser/Thr protein kinase)